MTRKKIPLFPLPDTILFPGQIMPLHIFEPRYRQMTQDLLDGRGELVIGTVLGEDKNKLSGVAPVCPIGGVGQLEKYEPLDDGRFMIVLLGLKRVQIFPIPDHPAPYPVAEIEDFDDEIEHCSANELESIRDELMDALSRRGISEDTIPEQVSLEQMADLVLMAVSLDAEQRYQIYSTPSVLERIKLILDAESIDT